MFRNDQVSHKEAIIKSLDSAKNSFCHIEKTDLVQQLGSDQRLTVCSKIFPVIMFYPAINEVTAATL